MMSWTSFSQDTTTKQVKVSTLKKIKRQIDKCDSLKVAYELKSASLNDLIDTNLLMFNELEEHRNKRLELKKRIDEINEQNLKLSKRKKNGLIYGISGTALGVIIGVIISK